MPVEGRGDPFALGLAHSFTRACSVLADGKGVPGKAQRLAWKGRPQTQGGRGATGWGGGASVLEIKRQVRTFCFRFRKPTWPAGVQALRGTSLAPNPTLESGDVN